MKTPLVKPEQYAKGKKIFGQSNTSTTSSCPERLHSLYHERPLDVSTVL